MNKLGIYLAGVALASLAPIGIGHADMVPVDSDRWEFLDNTVKHQIDCDGTCLRLQAGKAVVRDSNFTNGIIEFDVMFPEEFSAASTILPDNRAFVGSVFRLEDEENYEKFYMRPHRMPNDEDGAQYAPVYNGWSAWQLYWGKGFITPVSFVHEEWMHVKLIVSGDYLEVYIGDMVTPKLMSPLKRPLQAGKVGVKLDPVPPTGYAYFKNFSYEEMDNPPTSKAPPPPVVAPAGTVLSWQISDTFKPTDIAGKVKLTDADRQTRTWTPLNADPSTGVTNLAISHLIASNGGGDGKNTVFARTTITSDGDQVKKLKFGFCNIGKLYLNGQLMYSEDNSFRTRSQNFMGSLGLFDEIYLPLKAGDNELWVAVTGMSASWGLQAQLEDLNGVHLSNSPEGVGESFADPANQFGYCVASYNPKDGISIPYLSVQGFGGGEYALYNVNLKPVGNPKNYLFTLGNVSSSKGK